MNNDILQQWNEMNKNFMESMKQLGEIINITTTKMTERQMAMVNTYMESMVKQMQVAGEAKGAQELMSSQAKLAKEFNDKLLVNTQQTLDIMAQSRADLATWMEKGIETATKATNESVSAAVKPKK